MNSTIAPQMEVEGWPPPIGEKEGPREGKEEVEGTEGADPGP